MLAWALVFSFGGGFLVDSMLFFFSLFFFFLNLLVLIGLKFGCRTYVLMTCHITVF